jgi:23S rRNA pseudouridine2605 synthase
MGRLMAFGTVRALFLLDKVRYNPVMKERLQKFLSQAGVASRRHAEEMIKQGLIKVNGQVVKILGTKIDPTIDKIEVVNKKIKPQGLIYLAMNKPKRCMTTRKDPQRRKTVFDLLPPELREKVWSVGRLDFNTEGLLIFTNDGDLTQVLTHPSKEHEKEYEVELDKEPSEGKIEKIKTGVWLEGRKTSPAKVRVDGKKVYLIIHEGWNRQVRRMFTVLGFTVRNLRRIRIGKLKLGNLPSGQWIMIKKESLT